MSAWQTTFVSAPAFAHLKPWLDRFQATDWPDLATLNQFAKAQNLRNAIALPIRFTPQNSACGQHDYETRIHASGLVPSRERNWHDLFNALTWLAFPATKAALNAVHQTTLLPGLNRLPASDAATLFDESGLVLAGEDDSLARLLAARRWREAFVARRDDWKNIRVHVIGHAVLEKLLTPWPGITAKCLFIKTRADASLKSHDATIAEQWQNNRMTDARALFPLPVLGIPGWWPANEDPEFYANQQVFRPPR
jgi:hypothetical protein